MSNKRAVSCFCRGAEIPDKVFAFFELLLFETQHSTDAFQRKRKPQRRRPDHRAMPGGRIEILSGRASEIAGQAHTLELRVECPFGHGRVGQRRVDIGGECFSGSQIHDLHRRTVRRVAEKQHLKVRGFGVAVHTALGEVLGGEGLNIDAKCFHTHSFLRNMGGRGQYLPPTEPSGGYFSSFMRFSWYSRSREACSFSRFSRLRS